ncbi:glycerophosphodiester phosphodiesterase [Bacillus sp. Xin]|uniref:glycerophosphodiester phosphodiesterase n=1 Tax=unclassified Bacillus (in: firmicutes) TaxID=185979 RepID=UPI001573D4FF|nr:MULTISPECIES: glycerophosphodiester phosphodiesterase [unclassified Bacillus (in: firmicutes)]MBC6974379.1 glycerophosphodiester phosphodiesterase [Bacillus sp. Xin]NSW34835.1 glycerophosphodiester phosphodiesterase [Bacillus sp. Xin1]
MTHIFAHRGAAGTYPENTMISFEAAESFRADGIELDVQFTKDGKVVVIHDETVDRTTNGKGAVRNYLYEDLRKLDASHKFSEKVGFCPIPLLEEVLGWLQSNRLLLNIEFKNNKIPYRGLEEEVITLIRKFNLEERTVFSSFNHYSMKKCHMMAQDIQTAILYREGLHSPWAYAKKMGATAIHPNHRYLQDAIAELTMDSGIEVRPYTINDETVMRKYFDMNISAIITDYPETARALLPVKK